MTDATLDLECCDLVRRFGDFAAVDRVSLRVPQGQFFSILGPSGCGKTTLLRMIAGFDEPDDGEILIKSRSMRGVPPNRRPVNIVFQHLALFPMMSVSENVAYGLKRRGERSAQVLRKVQSALDRVNLGDAGGKRIDQLSGGQKQRVAIARCLVLEPSVLLLDEPLGALDLKLREHMKVELKQLQQQVGTTFVYITHDQSEALVMSDRIAIMNRGRFEQVGSPQDLYYDPATAFVAGFVGDANRWRGRVHEVDAGDLVLVTEDGLRIRAERNERHALAPGAQAQIFVRPEAVRLRHGDSPDAPGGGNLLAGEVVDLWFNGADSRVMVRAGRSQIVVRLPQTEDFANVRRGDSLHVQWPSAKTRIFPWSAP